MLTIGQLAAYAGVTVRAVRHYHAKGLLPEPRRDHAGYRRYDAVAVAELVKIRTLAEAGVPLARVRELLAADQPQVFDAALDEIDHRLRAEIRDRQRHRQRIRQLSAGDSLALPPEAVAYLDRLRSLGFGDRFVAGERDAWILVAAERPGDMPLYMRLKQQQLDHPVTLALYRDIEDAIDWSPDDPRLPALSDRMAAVFEAAHADGPTEGEDAEPELPAALVHLLDSVFLESVPAAARLLVLLEQRGWRGWTDMRPVDVDPLGG